MRGTKYGQEFETDEDTGGIAGGGRIKRTVGIAGGLFIRPQRRRRSVRFI